MTWCLSSQYIVAHTDQRDARSCRMEEISKTQMAISYYLDGKMQAANIPFDPPLSGYEEVRPRLVAMKHDAEDKIGMVSFPVSPLMFLRPNSHQCRRGVYPIDQNAHNRLFYLVAQMPLHALFAAFAVLHIPQPKLHPPQSSISRWCRSHTILHRRLVVCQGSLVDHRGASFLGSRRPSVQACSRHSSPADVLGVRRVCPDQEVQDSGADLSEFCFIQHDSQLCMSNAHLPYVVQLYWTLATFLFGIPSLFEFRRQVKKIKMQSISKVKST